MPEKQKEGDFLTEILGVFGCEAIVPFWFFFACRRSSLECKEKQKKPCARQRPKWPDKATRAKKNIEINW